MLSIPVLSVIVVFGSTSAFAETPHLDRYGDPLPPGAIARLGSLRLLCEGDLANVVFSKDGRIVAAVRNAPVIQFFVAGRPAPAQQDTPSQFWEVATGRAAPAPENKQFINEALDNQRNQWQEISRRLRKANPALKEEELRIAVESPDGSLIATSSRQQHFQIWDGRTLKELPAWSGESQARTDYLAISPDSKLLAATSAGSTQVWEIITGRLRHTLPALGSQSYASTFSPDSKTLAVADGDVVTLWNTATGTPLHEFGHTYLVDALAFTPDGQSLISGASFTDRLIHRWNAHTGEHLATWRGHTSAVYALAVSRDGSRAISASYDGTCRLWEFTTGRELGQIGKHTNPIWSADLATDGRSVATVDNDQALLWQVDGKRPMRSFGHGGKRVMEVALSSDGRQLLTRTEEKPGVVRVWDVGTAVEVRRLTSPSAAAIIGFDLSRDNQQVVTAEKAGAIQIWDLRTGHIERTLTVAVGEMPRSTKWAYATFSPDRRCVAVGASDGTVRLVEVATGQERLRWEGHKRGVSKILFSPDGAFLASGSRDRTILIWDVFAGLANPPTELDPLWKELKGKGPTAYIAMRKLLAAGDSAAALIAQRLRPAPEADNARIAALVADLDSKQFVLREQASLELARLGEAAEGALQNTLNASPTPESRRRVDALLANIKVPSGERLQALRAIELLERLATPEARKALQTLAAGAAGASRTNDAVASLWRLDHR
jgi:WD40 repeat protein